MTIKYNGKHFIERPLFLEDNYAERYDKKYGKGNWVLQEPICKGLCPDCGYGEPLANCLYKDGRCVRPLKGGEKE